MTVEERKVEIMNASVKIFASKGYEKTSITDIAQDSKVPEPTIYRLCGSKENILLLIYERFWQKVLNDIKGVVESKWGEDAIEKLRKVLTIAEKIVSEDMSITKIVLTTRILPPEKITDTEQQERRLKIREMNRESLKLIDKIITAGQDDGKITNKLKSQVIRQMLFGSFYALSYSLFVQCLNKESIGYTVDEARKGIYYLLQSLLNK